MYKNILYGFFLTIIIISLTFLYIINKSFPKNFYEIFHLLNLKYLIFSFIFFGFFYTFDNLRIFIISRSTSLKYPFLYGYMISFISSFGATVTPFHVGGEFLFFYILKRIKGETYKIMSIITFKVFSGIFFYIIFSPFTIRTLIKNPEQTKRFGLIFVFTLFIAINLIFLWQLILKKKFFLNKKHLIIIKYTFLKYLVVCKNFFKFKRKNFLAVLFISILMYCSLIFIGVFLTKAFNSNASLYNIFFAQLPLIYAIFLSPTPGGSGIGELGALIIFSKFLNPVRLGIFAILWRIISQYLGATIGGIILLVILLKDIFIKTHEK